MSITLENQVRVLSYYCTPLVSKVSSPVRYIIYRGERVELTEDDIKQINNLLPDFWHSDNDKMFHFVINEDGSYFAEREKQVYNYNTKQTESKVYFFDGDDKDSAKNVAKILFETFTACKARKYVNLKENINQRLSQVSFFKSYILNTRQLFLQQSDYLFLGDYTGISAEEKEKWAVYRQELRDITAQEAWVTKNYADVTFPVSPNISTQFDLFGLAVEKLNIDITTCDIEDPEQFIKNFPKLFFHLNVINTLSTLGYPNLNEILTPSLAEFNITDDPLELLENATSDKMVNVYIDWLNNFSEIETKINAELEKINASLTVADIYDMMTKNIQAAESVENLIDDLASEEL